MTVERMRAEMSHAEYVGWHVYHGRRAQRQELQQKTSAARQRRHSGRR